MSEEQGTYRCEGEPPLVVCRCGAVIGAVVERGGIKVLAVGGVLLLRSLKGYCGECGEAIAWYSPTKAIKAAGMMIVVDKLEPCG